MSTLSFRQQGGARVAGIAGQRGITSIAATGIVTTSAAITTPPLVGSLMEIFGATANKQNKVGNYTVTAVSGATYTLRPKPVPSGTGTLTRLADLPEYTLGANNVTSVLVNSFSTNQAFLQVAGANFKTAGIRRNDRVYLTGSSTTANNGGWIIQEVISQTVLLLRPPDAGELMQTEAVGTGTVRVFHGRIRIDVVDRHRTSWTTIGDSTITFPRKGPFASKFYRFGSGDITDYMKINTIGEQTAAGLGEIRKFIRLEGVSIISFYQQSFHDTYFYSIDEIVVANNGNGTVGACSFSTVNTASWFGDLKVQLGNQPGNRYSVGNGSAWVGVVPTQTKVDISAFGSYIDLTGSANDLSPLAGNITGCIVRPRINIGSGITESITAYGDSGNSAGGLSVLDVGDQNNLLLAKQGSTSAIQANGIISGLLLSDEVNTPVWASTASSGVVEFRDPRGDYDLTEIINNVGSSISQKTYTFNPRFVSRDTSGTAPSPVFYLHVQIYEINETDETVNLVKDEVTNTLGYMENGAVILKRQETAAGGGFPDVGTDFSHRVITQGGGFVLGNEVIQITASRLNDWSVDRINPDYESEFGE